MRARTAAAAPACVVALVVCAFASGTSGCSSSTAPQATINGRALLDGSSDSSGIVVFVSGRLLNEDSSLTDANGNYQLRISAERDQRYFIIAFAESTLEHSQPTYIDVRAGTSPTLPDFHFTPVGNVSGTATLDAANGNAGIVVAVPGTQSVALTDDSGAYTLKDVPIGTWSIVAKQEGFADASVPGVVVAYTKSVTAAPLTLHKP